MGIYTRAQLITKGILTAGRDDLASPIGDNFDVWLRSVYAMWPWPFLIRRKSALSLPTGTQSLSVGAGASGITAEIQRLIEPIWVYDSTYATKSLAKIRQLTGRQWTDEDINDPATFRGLPGEFKARADTSTWGKWSLIPIARPDKDYLISFDYLEMPVAPLDTDKPFYPNDRTMLQAIFSETLKYTKGADSPDYQQALELLVAQINDDKMKFGQSPGINDLLQLDPGIFKVPTS
jgi:hypothetical protein